MDAIVNNVNALRDSVQRHQYQGLTALDVLTAFHVLLKKPLDYSITDDKYFTFILECMSNVPSDADNRRYWLDTMCETYEKITATSPSDSNWLMLKANLVFFAPVGVYKGLLNC